MSLIESVRTTAVQLGYGEEPEKLTELPKDAEVLHVYQLDDDRVDEVRRLGTLTFFESNDEYTHWRIGEQKDGTPVILTHHRIFRRP